MNLFSRGKNNSLARYIRFVKCCFSHSKLKFISWRNRRLVSLVGKAPVYRAGGLGSIPGWTTTQVLK